MLSILYTIGCIRAETPNASAVAQEAALKYERGLFSQAKELYKSAGVHLGEDEALQEKYYQLLIKLGDFEDLINEKKNAKPKNMNYIESAIQYLQILGCGDLSKIAGLMKVCPNKFEVIIAAAKQALLTGNNNDANKYLMKLQAIRPSAPEINKIWAQYQCAIGNYVAAAKRLELSGEKASAERLLRMFNQKQVLDKMSRQNPKAVIQKYSELLALVAPLMASDTFEPSLYSKMYTDILQMIVDISVDDQVPGSFNYAAELAQRRPGEKNAYNHIIAAAIDGKDASEIKALRMEYKGVIKRPVDQKIEKVIDRLEREQEERKEEARKKKLEEEAKKAYEEEKKRSMEDPRTRAGKDFLKYYETLGINRYARPQMIKKAFKTAFRKASRLKDLDERDKTQSKVNKAYKILMDPKMKQQYDSGIDPENPYDYERYKQQEQQKKYYQGGRQRYGGYNGYMMDTDLNDILNSFMGGGGRRRMFVHSGGRQHFF